MSNNLVKFFSLMFCIVGIFCKFLFSALLISLSSINRFIIPIEKVMIRNGTMRNIAFFLFKYFTPFLLLFFCTIGFYMLSYSFFWNVCLSQVVLAKIDLQKQAYFCFFSKEKTRKSSSPFNILFI